MFLNRGKKVQHVFTGNNISKLDMVTAPSKAPQLDKHVCTSSDIDSLEEE